MMSTRTGAREARLAQLIRTMQLMTGQSVLLSEVIAASLGLNSTDLEALGVVQTREATTAGDLAAATGLSTGAVTTVIDRLERAGFLRREPDAKDRRKVLLRLRPSKVDRAIALYARLDADMRTLLSRYSEEEIELLIDFLAASTRLAGRHITALQVASRNSRARKSLQNSGEIAKPPRRRST